MLTLVKTKVAEEKIYAAKKPTTIWDVNVENVVISKSSRYLIGYLDKVVRPFVLILPKMSEYVKTIKV